MRFLFIALVTTVSSFNVLANPSSIKFVANDQAAETQVCVEAATNGFHSAKDKAIALGVQYQGFEYATKCNGQSLVRFAKKITRLNEVADIKTTYRFVAANDMTESQICAEAVTKGVSFVAEQYGSIDGIQCNGKKIINFVKKYQASFKA